MFVLARELVICRLTKTIHFMFFYFLIMIFSTILNVSKFKKINITVVIICSPWFLLIIPNFYDRFYACNGTMTKVKAFRVYRLVFRSVKENSHNYQPKIGNN